VFARPLGIGSLVQGYEGHAHIVTWEERIVRSTLRPMRRAFFQTHQEDCSYSRIVILAQKGSLPVQKACNVLVLYNAEIFITLRSVKSSARKLCDMK
jgi:hypothetical protein